MSSPSHSHVENELRLATEAYRAGDLSGAESRVDNLLGSHAGRADVQLAKGIIQIARRDQAGGLKSLTLCLQIEPKNTEALGWAAFVSLNLLQFEEAESFARSFVQISPSNARAHYFLANALRALGRIEDALKAIDRSLELNKDDADSLLTKARLLNAWQLPALAIEFYRRALAIRPVPGAAIDLAQILLRESQPQEALVILNRVVSALPAELRPYDLIAQAQTELQQFEEAERNWLLAGEFAQDPVAIIQRRATAEIAVGRFDKAESLLMGAMMDDLRSGHSFSILSTARKMKSDDLPLAERMQRLLDKGELDGTQSAELNYALGKTFDDLKDYERAISHFDEANRICFDLSLKRGSLRFNQDEARAYTDALIHYFTKDRILDLEEDGLSSPLPLFVVGMARSGTTLTSQILTANSKVRGGSERSFWPERAIEFLQWNAGHIDLKLGLLLQFAKDYLELLDPKQPDVLHVVDKNPNNFQFAPMLLGLFPESKIVHLKRHPVDNVLSMWMTPFSEAGSFTSNRENLVFHYREQNRLLRHFQDVLPEDRFASFRYEDLTSNPDRTITAMLDFLGLEHEDACFEPEKNLRAILTPSVQQVRQPIHQGSQARWKNYEPWLGAFAGLLDDAEFE